MQSTVSSYNVENECTSGHNADKKLLQSQVFSSQDFANYTKLAEEFGSSGHHLVPELRATSSHLSRFRRINDVANSHAFTSSATSVSSECSSITTSTSNLGKATMCHVCLKPPTTAFSEPLIRCTRCRRHYHSECHSPPARLGDNVDHRDTIWACSRCTRTSKKFSKMENSYLAPWTLSSNSSSDGAERPIVADQRSSKRCKVQTHVVDLSGLQLMQQRETSTTFVERAKSPTQVRSTSSFDRKTMKNDEKILEDKDVQVVWQPICSIILKNDTKNSEQQEMDPEIISRLVEMAESDARLGQLVEVLFSGEASVSEREEWNRYYNSLSSSASPLDAEQFEKYTSPIVAPRKTPKVIPISFETPRASPPSNVTSFHISGHVANELSPPYSPIARQHDRLPTESPQEDEIVFLHERLRTPPKQAGALDGAGVANAPLYISPERAVVVKKSSVVPVADPFAQAKRKRAQAEAEIKKRLKTSKIIVSEEVKVVTQPIVQTSTSSVSRGSASLQILSVKVQNLEDCIAEYQAELQRKNAKIQDLSTEVEREKSSPRLSLRKAKQQIASLKGDLEESQRAARRAQTKVRELRSKMERMPRPISDNVPATASATQDVTNIELSNLRSEVSALRSLVAAKDKPHPKYEFVHRNLFLAPLVLCERPRTVSERSRGRPPKSTSSHTESDEDEEEATNLTRNERALRKFDKAIGLPQDPIPVRVDGMLAYRDGTRDVNGRLPRAKTLFKVGRNVPGELM